VHEAAVPSVYGHKDHWPYVFGCGVFFGCDSTIVQGFGLLSSLLLFAALGWVATNAFCIPL